MLRGCGIIQCSVRKIEAIIKPEELERVNAALSSCGKYSLAVMEAGVIWWERSSKTVPPIINEDALRPRIKIEIFLEDHESERVSATLARVVASDEEDRTRIFITQSEESIRYRTES